MKTNELSPQEMQATNGGMSVMPAQSNDPGMPQSQEQGYTSAFSSGDGTDANTQGTSSVSPTMGDPYANDHPNYVK